MESLGQTPACWNCGVALTALPQPLGRRTYCPRCEAPLRCCRMCASWDAAAGGWCREPMAETQKDRSAANFCDFFRLAIRTTEKEAPQEEAEQARKRLRAVFGEIPAPHAAYRQVATPLQPGASAPPTELDTSHGTPAPTQADSERSGYSPRPAEVSKAEEQEG